MHREAGKRSRSRRTNKGNPWGSYVGAPGLRRSRGHRCTEWAPRTGKLEEYPRAAWRYALYHPASSQARRKRRDECPHRTCPLDDWVTGQFHFFFEASPVVTPHVAREGAHDEVLRAAVANDTGIADCSISARYTGLHLRRYLKSGRGIHAAGLLCACSVLRSCRQYRGDSMGMAQPCPETMCATSR